MAVLNLELYGERSNFYAEDPEWDDVTPIPQQEPEGALAAIAYPDDYAEGTVVIYPLVKRRMLRDRSNGLPPSRHGSQGLFSAVLKAHRAYHLHESGTLYSLAIPLLEY